jgi:hypothetical protein
MIPSAEKAQESDKDYPIDEVQSLLDSLTRSDNKDGK